MAEKGERIETQTKKRGVATSQQDKTSGDACSKVRGKAVVC